MPEAVFVATKVVLSGPEHLEKCIEKLSAVAEAVHKNEPDTLMYYVGKPRENDDGKTVWVIEKFTTAEARSKHDNGPYVEDIHKWFGEEKTIDMSQTVTRHAHLLFPDSDIFRGEALNAHKEPYVLVGEVDYHPGGLDKSAVYWKGVIDWTREREEGTMMYAITKDQTKDEAVLSFEAYDSEAYLWDVHVKQSDAVSESVKNTKDLRTSLKHNKMIKAGGYLYKPSP